MKAPTGLRAVTTVPGARRLFLSTLVGRLPEGMESLALVLLFQHATGGFAVAGAMVAVYAVASAGLSPVMGTWVARSGPARVVLTCAGAQALSLAGVVAGVALDAPLGVLFLLVALAGLSYPPIAACARATWGSVAPTHHIREAGYAVDAVLQEAIWMVGPALVSLTLLVAGPTAGLAATAVLVLVGAIFFVTVPLLASRPPDPKAVHRRLPVTPRLRMLLLGCAVTGLGFGITEVAVPALATDIASATSTGMLLVAMSAGSVVGGLLVSAHSWRSRVSARHAIAAIALGLLTCSLAAATSLPLAVALAFVAGAPWSPLLAGQYAALADATPEDDTVAAFAWSSTAVVAGMALGAAVAGLMVDHGGPRSAFLVAGTAFAVVGLLVAEPSRR